MVVSSLLVTRLVVVILHNLTGQARPYTAGVVTNPRIIVEGYDSFPSQHAAFMWSQVVSMSFVNRRVGLVIALLAGLVAWSRVVVGAHYIHDVIAGAIIGICIPLAVWFFFRRHLNAPPKT